MADHAIGHGGSDAISLYAYLSTGGDYRETYKRLANDSLVRAAMAAGTKPPPAKVATPAKDDPAKLALARHPYAQAGALHGTPAAAYLKKRGLGHTAAWGRMEAVGLWHPMRGRF